MEFSAEVLKIIIILVPGIVSMLVLERMIVHTKIDFDRFAIYTIVMSFFSYLLSSFIWSLLYHVYTVLEWNTPRIAAPKMIIDSFMTVDIKMDYYIVLWVSLLGIVLSLLLAKAINKKYLHRLGQLLKITKKYGDESVWDYFHNKQDETIWVTVRDMKNDLMYFGWIEAYSDDSIEYDELLLRNVDVCQNSTGDNGYVVDEAYICGKREDLRIEIFTNEEETRNV
jgi:hypothetical protein